VTYRLVTVCYARPAGDFAVDKILVGAAMPCRKAAATIRPVTEGHLARQVETPPKLGHIERFSAEGWFRPSGTAWRIIAPEENRHVAPVAERRNRAANESHNEARSGRGGNANL
jgi:hypothetical protein